MNGVSEKMIEVYNIINQCEKSELASFAYQDSMISVQFNKLMKEDISYYIGNQKDNIRNFTNELKIEDVKVGMNEIAASDELQDEKNETEEFFIIKSPFVGTIELSKQIKESEGEITITKGDVIGLIEAMKIYNDIITTVTGTIVEILVEDSSLVEFDQPILKVRVNKHE